MRLLTVVLSLSLLSACRSVLAPAVVEATPPLASAPAERARAAKGAIETLRARVNTLLAEPTLAPGTWGLEVRSLRTRETLVEVFAHRLLMPASTLKTITLAVAAEQLGWDFRFETRLVPSGPIASGRLDGDLVIIGSGDPSLDDWDGTASSVFASWAAQLKALGIRTIRGRIVGDDHAFTDTGFGRGWMWDDMADDYSPPASGLQFNQGAAKVSVRPGPSPGAPALTALEPPYAPLRLRNTVRTGAPGAQTAIEIAPAPLSDEFIVSGTMAADAAPIVRYAAVLRPTQYFVNAARAGLIAEGIDVQGDAVDADDLHDARSSVDATAAVITYYSQPLPLIAGTLMQLSQNMYAETLLHTLGRLRGEGGTADAGRDVVQSRLESWGLPASELVMADGSGLSRYDLVTPSLLTSVLAHVFADETLKQSYLDSLPVAGQPGMLEKRMRGTRAEGNATAKTGSFTNARSLAGFVQTRDGEPLVFAMIANQYGIPTSDIDRVMDAIVVALAEFGR